MSGMLARPAWEALKDNKLPCKSQYTLCRYSIAEVGHTGGLGALYNT